MNNIQGFNYEPDQYFDVLPDLVCVTTLNGYFTRINKAWKKLVTIPEADLASRRIVDFAHAEDQDGMNNYLKMFEQGGTAQSIGVRFHFGKQVYRHLEWRASRVNDEVFWLSRDISSEIDCQTKIDVILGASEEFMEMGPEDVDFLKIAEQIRILSGAQYVVVNIYEEDGRVYTTKAIAGVKDPIKQAVKLLGFPVLGKKWPTNPIRHKRIQSHNMVRFESVTDFSEGALSPAVCKMVEKAFNLGETWLVKIEKDGNFLGDFSLFMGAGEKFFRQTVVEMYSRQVGLLFARHKAELALRQSEAKFRDHFNKDLTGNFISTVDGEFILINEALARIFGFDSIEEMMADQAEVTYVKDGDRSKFLNLVREKRHLDMFEETLKRRDGTEIIVLENVIGEFNDEDELVRLKGYLIDVTELKQAEIRLRDSEKLLNSSQVISGIGSYTLDIRSGVWQGSAYLDEMFGIGQDNDRSVSGWLSVIHPDDRTMMDHYFAEEVLQNKKRFDKEYRIIQKTSGSVLWVHGIGEVEYDAVGNPIRMIGTIQDRTERRKADEELIRAKEQAEASDRLKTAFLNNISHEVRTPLNGILGFGEMITEPGITDEDKAVYLDILNSSSDRLLNTINDYMDISMISSGNLEIRSSLFNLHDLVSQISRNFKAKAKNKQLELKLISLDLSNSFLLDTDGELLKKVLWHLIDNAIKYSVHGTIEFGYFTRSGELEFFVKDEGIGIQPDKLEHIFDFFIQEDSSTTRKYEGSGLGLSIAKGLVELLGGRIWVESEKGRGSTFSFTLGCQVL